MSLLGSLTDIFALACDILNFLAYTWSVVEIINFEKVSTVESTLKHSRVAITIELTRIFGELGDWPDSPNVFNQSLGPVVGALTAP